MPGSFRSWADKAHKDSLQKPLTYQRCPYCDRKILGTLKARKHRHNCKKRLQSRKVGS